LDFKKVKGNINDRPLIKGRGLPKTRKSFWFQWFLRIHPANIWEF